MRPLTGASDTSAAVPAMIFSNFPGKKFLPPKQVFAEIQISSPKIFSQTESKKKTKRPRQFSKNPLFGIFGWGRIFQKPLKTFFGALSPQKASTLSAVKASLSLLGKGFWNEVTSGISRATIVVAGDWQQFLNDQANLAKEKLFCRREASLRSPWAPWNFAG